MFQPPSIRFSTSIPSSFSSALNQNSRMSSLKQQRNESAELAFLQALDFYNVGRKMFRECDESYVLVCDRLAEHPVRHHDSFHGLRQAARAGCHLCNLIEAYCTISSVNPNVPVILKFDIRNTCDRRHAFDVSVDKKHTEIRLGLKDDKHALSQLTRTYYHPTGGIPDDIFDMIGDWLRRCQAEHQECRDDSTTHMPTRLVDVGTLDSSTVHLIETGNGFNAPYLTLSHCWGQNASIVRRTTGGNLEIFLKDLPHTFKDAITTTRRLGFTYLWIDSLCIIQGDKIDWERESANMASIYSKGILNLAATYSSDSHGGLFLERTQHHVTSFSWKQQIDPVSSRNAWGEWMQSRQVCWTFDPQSEFGDLGLGRPLPLISRGWVLQENVLSSRTVHFLPGEIIWECRELSARESIYSCPARQSEEFRGKVVSSFQTVSVTRNGPKNFLRTTSDSSGDQKTTSGQTSGGASHQTPQGQLYRQWYEIVTQYSQKNLTRSEDRLPAIWALAQKFQEMTGDEYFSGLWKNDILTGLLFKRFQPRPECRTKQTRCGPSWSWASTECRIEFEYATPPPFSSTVKMDRLPDASLQRFVIDPTEPRSLSMGRTRQSQLEVRTLARNMVGRRLDWNPSPGEKVARAMGIKHTFGGHNLHSEIWRTYGEMRRKYQRKAEQRSIPGYLPVGQWLREARFRKAASTSYEFSHSLETRTDCYFGWAGAKFIEERRWEDRNNRGRSRGQDKILGCGSFDLDFDNIELARSYEQKPVLCLHIKGTHGLLVELDGNSQMYRRVGVYRQMGTEHKTDAWEPITVTLV
ncbi:het domain-containing [Fusarium sporotrichioides]|uniref:Het domain-containing n=1 Tax=Fusarium sporotrichioides TaxID=5514 RepID=A0A395S8M1_FUSSP|nr:het domain-containing [Fusarium sporotrichioides]